MLLLELQKDLMRSLFPLIFLLFSVRHSAQTIPSLIQQKDLIEASMRATGHRVEQPFQLGFQNFIFLNGDTLFNFNGYSNMFQLKKNKVLRLDDSKFHGFNFNRYLFTHQNRIYQIGGYGFFRTNNELLIFVNRGWEVCATSGEKPNYIDGIIQKKENEIFFSNNCKSGNGVYNEVLDQRVFVLDLNTKEWQILKQVSNPFFSGFKRIFSTNIYFVYSNGKSFAIQKQNCSYAKIVPENRLSKNAKLNFLAICGLNKMLAERYMNDQLIDTIVIDLDHFYANPNFRKEALYSSEAKNALGWVNIVFIIGLLILLAGYNFWLKRKPKSSIKPELANLILKIEALKGRTINSDELDDLLEIRHLIGDSRKLRRHRILTDIENVHPGLIRRNKMDNDKRKFQYIISR